MGFKEKLVKYLQDSLTKAELEALPSGFQTIGKLIIIKLKPELLDKKKIIAEAYLELLPYIRSVYLNLGKIEGQLREPEKIEFLSGDDNPLVIHKEHGVSYIFDITKIMFSQGNLRERRYLANLVGNDEIVVDMFAGIGYFSLPIAIIAEPKKIYSIELNPTAYQFLLKNIKLNRVEDLIEPLQGNCREKVFELRKRGVRADRIIMGVFPTPKEYIQDALKIVKDLGTIIHYEGVTDKDEYLELYNEFSQIASQNNFETFLKEHRFVKSYGPNLYHIVYDISVHHI
ncbi:MAG: tRNA wyosine derivatives biosynthesis protein Taw2 [Promethearchaeota archaeon]|nr:MAG: tRNA wyosine derivatives biosynthesis protein Taw2 [Candidatus Lokiarchaeota archaeon]